jgi:pimeloyl-ACP methyl ester carboxylesterase
VPDTTITSADGTTLAARWTGRGSPLVLVHGALGDLDTFALVEGLLAERHSVWVYSRRGRGGSGDGPDYSLQREVDDLVAVVAAAGHRVHLVGHSGGAAYCLLAATQLPRLRSLVLYEPPLGLEALDPTVIDDVEAALDDGDPDRAVGTLFPAIGVAEHEQMALRSLEPVWSRIREGVRLCPRELRAGLDEGLDQRTAFEPPDVPTLYLHGEETDAPIFRSPSEVATLFPKAQLRKLAGQRHLAFAFDPSSFAEAVLAFTTANDH